MNVFQPTVRFEDNMDAESTRKYIETHLKEQPGTKIQYGHPSPRFFKPMALTPHDVKHLRRPDRPLFLYIHIPFCPPTDPPACGFCLFAREDMTSYAAVRNYLEVLRAELDLYAQVFQGEELACVYIGGGTPNVLRAPEYGLLFGWIKERFRVAPGAEVTLEGVPQLFHEDRLAAMAEAGVTRVSVGAQQLDDNLLRYSGRRNTVRHVHDSIEGAHARGMVVNVDLICGWFEQPEDGIARDVSVLLPHQPESIVVHPLTLAGQSSFSDARDALASTEDTKRAFLNGRNFLLQNGYRGTSYTDYALKNPQRGPDEVQYLRFYREILGYDRLGVGYGANSLFAGTPRSPGATFRNVASLDTYAERVQKGHLPIADGFTFSDVDLSLLYVLKGLEGTPFLTAEGYRNAVGRDLLADFGGPLSALEQIGWLARNGSEYVVQGDGVFYMPVIQRAVSERRNARLRSAAKLPLSLPVI
ncbi:MAG: radical SAM protein [Polyangiaceae bacterium]|nr:radical SAM protein [Polyangiaceae bacterium]